MVSSMTVVDTITYHLIDDKEMRGRLQAELREVMPQTKWTQLKQLRYGEIGAI